MKRVLCIIIMMLAVLFSSIGCADAPTAPTASPFATVESVTTLINGVKADLNTKANKGDVDSIIARINTAEQKINTLVAPNLSGYYTSAQVDAAIKKALDDYKATIVAGTSPSPTGTTGTITTILDPSNPQIIGNTLGFSFIARFKNTGTTTLYVSPNIKATQTTGSAATSVTTFTATTSASSYSPITFTYAPNVFPTTLGTTQVRAIATGGGYNSNGQLPIFGNSELIVTFTVVLSSTVATQWSFTVEQ